jgi:mRNA-degrading endonuclease RelE of RelBE toxin-antitoxin system
VPYEIEYETEALDELARLRPFERRRIVEAIEIHLRRAPESTSRNQKRLQAAPEIRWALPVWELRIEAIRVFYRIEGPKVVIILAVRRKGRKTTTEIL